MKNKTNFEKKGANDYANVAITNYFYGNKMMYQIEYIFILDNAFQ